jgi:hypothetical protein
MRLNAIQLKMIGLILPADDDELICIPIPT